MTQEAKTATTTIPIVMIISTDPVGAGLVKSLAQPGGNITGLRMYVDPVIEAKRLELFKEILPRVSRVAYLGMKEDEQDPRLLDLDVMDALHVLIRGYVLEEPGAGTRTSRLSGPAERVHDLARRMCEWRQGRQPLNADDPAEARPPIGELSIAGLVLLRC